jgi:pimeloyl-ACP methyl ester carboxylesterase
MTALMPFYKEWGPSRDAAPVTVMLLHGVGGSHESWSLNVPALVEAGYRVLAWDAPGYGASPAIRPLNMAEFARALQALLKAQGGRRTVLLGHSMGGMIAQELMALLPDEADQLVHGLVLFATSAAFGKPGGDWQQKFLSDRFAALDAGLGMEGLAKVLVGGMLATGTPDRVRHMAMSTMVKVPEATYRQALAAIVHFNRAVELSSIAVPTLCLACDQDKTAPAEVMQRMAGRLAQGQFECFGPAGHLGNLEQAPAFNAAVLRFLKQHFPAQAVQ